MSKPSALPIWATDTNIASGSEAGTPTKVEPASGFKAQGWVPGLNFVGPYQNWFKNLVYQWCAYLDNLHGESAFLGANYAWTGTHTTSNELGYPSAKTRVVQLGSGGWAPVRDPFDIAIVQDAGGGSGPRYAYARNASGAPAGGDESLVMAKQVDLPQGAVITSWRATVESDSGAPMTVSLMKRVSSYAPPGSHNGHVTIESLVGLAQNASSGFVEVVGQSGLAETVAADTTYYLTFYTAAPGNSYTSALYDAEVTFTETRATGHF